MSRPGRKRNARDRITLAGKAKAVDMVTMPVEAGIPIEALVKAGAAPASNIKNRRLQVVAGDIVSPDGAIRSQKSPLARLHAHGRLDKDRETNDMLRDAGERYYRHWFEGGLKGIGAQNLDRVCGGDVDPAYQIPTTEYAAMHRRQFRDARARMGGWLASVVDDVVCEEVSLADAARRYTVLADPDVRGAISLTILKGALTTLADHFGMRVDRRCRTS